MKVLWIRIVLCASFALLLAACNQADDSSLLIGSSPPPTTNLPVNDTKMEPNKESTQMPQSTPSPTMESLIKKAKDDLAQRLSIDIAQISLVEAREVVWPDASLGCPQPGMKYKQIPYDGALIFLQAQGTTYEYHNGGTRGLFLCEQVSKDPNPPPKIDITDLTPHLQDDKNVPPTTPDNSIPPGEDQ